jgi:AcrR family transcriptional regulator
MSRSRSTRAHQLVLDAALRLVADQGIDASSMDAIAAASGVSKATIYKHWPDKDALCLELLSYLHRLDRPPVLRTGDNRADLVAVLSQEPPAQPSNLQSRLMPHFLAYAARNPAFAKAWRALVMQPTRIQLTQLLKRSMAQGTLSADLDLELSVALLAGPMMYRHVLSVLGRKLPENMAERVVDAFWRAHAQNTLLAPNAQPNTKRNRQPKSE